MQNELYEWNVLLSEKYSIHETHLSSSEVHLETNAFEWILEQTLNEMNEIEVP